MAFAFKQQSGIEAQVRHIAIHQIGKALEEARGGDLEFDAVVHGLRRRCKKLRGLVQLIKPHLKGWKQADRLFRDAARGLSGRRDAAVLVETFDELLSHEAGGIADGEEIRQWLESRVGQPLDAEQREAFLSDFVVLFEDARRHVEDWSLSGGGFAQIGDGLEDTYRRMRQNMANAESGGTPEAMHAWRKDTKYHWHHVSLLHRAAPDMLNPRRKALDSLGEMLGDHHNLAVLEEVLAERGDAASAIGAIGRRQNVLADDAFTLGQQLVAEKPGALRDRFEQYWSLLPGKD